MKYRLPIGSDAQLAFGGGIVQMRIPRREFFTRGS